MKKQWKKIITATTTFAKKRAKDAGEILGADLTLESAEVDVGGQKFMHRVNVEQRAAWELYVELNTRIATQELGDRDGHLREALSSLHTLFSVTRDILKRAGPSVAVGDESLGKYAMSILNLVLRPFLAKWHPTLADWEAQRPDGVSVAAHEGEWRRSETFRRELARLREVLDGFSDALAILARIAPAD